MMDSKRLLIKQLKDELDRWETLLAGLSEEQITGQWLPAELSLKDVIAHLWTWQQRSVSRMEAAAQNREPEFPEWPEGLDPDSEEDLEQVNAWIHESHRGRPWPEVYAGWKDNFLRFLELAEQIPEEDLLKPGRYAWLGEYPLALVLQASYEHHHEEHLEPLQNWLREGGSLPE